MAKLLVVAGTADAVDFLNIVPHGMEVLATTYSKLGETCIIPKKNIKIHSGALDGNGFLQLCKKENISHIVDMSHPFATEVSANVREAATALKLPYYRYDRASLEGMEHCLRYPDFPTAVEALKTMEGNLLLTIGSRNLHYFTALPDFFTRCYVRVLASSKILLELETMEIDPAHIFAMKGVATEELNIALAKSINAAAIVTKDSGLKGGIAEKYGAAKALNIPLIVIDKPQDTMTPYTDFQEILAAIRRDTH